MATHSNILAWRIHGQRGQVGYSPWVCKELDTSKQLTLSLSFPTGLPTSFFFLIFILFCSIAD